MTTTSAAERRQAAKAAYDAYLADCPARQLLDLLSNKWVALVLTALADGPQRHSDLARTIAGVSQKMLTQTLRHLERDGLVSRTVTPQVPVRVDYTLTPLGRELAPLMFRLKSWAQDHMDQILSARETYEARRSA
jgi:DNA-binding HxlR family transcriptional regulator